MKGMGRVLEDLSRMSKKQSRVIKGYEPKCKICNSGYQKEVEYIYELKRPYKDIKSYMENKGEIISEMSVSRHFRLHYPKRKAYFDNAKRMENESIEKAIKECPQLEDTFQDTVREPDYNKMILNADKTDFKEYIWKERSLIDVFLNDRGYCLTEYRFCSNIAPKEVSYMDDVIHDFNMALGKLDNVSFTESKRISLLTQKIKCLECRDFTNNILRDYMLHLLLKNVFGIEVESEKLNEFLNSTFSDLLFSDEVDYNFNKMDHQLKKLK